jgi:hypothetical protein
MLPTYTYTSLIILSSKKLMPAGHWRLMAIIPATQEAEIRRIMLGSQSQANSL